MGTACAQHAQHHAQCVDGAKDSGGAFATQERVQMARTCHTAPSSRPSRSSSLVEGALASLRLGVVQQRALPPVRPMASTAAIIELTLCRGETSAVGCSGLDQDGAVVVRGEERGRIRELSKRDVST